MISAEISTTEFVRALQQGDVAALKCVPKSDVHNHWLYGARIEAIEEHVGHAIARPPLSMSSIKEMVDWARANLWSAFKNTLEYHSFTIDASLRQAIEDGVTLLEMSIDVGICAEIFNGDAELFAQSIRQPMNIYADRITFVPELAIKGESVFPHEFFQQCLATGCFGSLDLYAVEDVGGSFENYTSIFRRARSAGLKLKAHVGEFGSAQLVKHAVETLELDEVQHGIAIAESPAIMRWIADNRIRLNVCPTSNVMLRRVPSMEKHPLRTLFDNGIDITINTDDLAIFGQSVSDEYLNVYRARLLSADELDTIRKRSISSSEN